MLGVTPEMVYYRYAFGENRRMIATEKGRLNGFAEFIPLDAGDARRRGTHPRAAIFRDLLTRERGN
jgi:hypothetical protein